jgi:hypothetical protein
VRSVLSYVLCGSWLLIAFFFSLGRRGESIWMGGFFMYKLHTFCDKKTNHVPMSVPFCSVCFAFFAMHACTDLRFLVFLLLLLLRYLFLSGGDAVTMGLHWGRIGDE